MGTWRGMTDSSWIIRERNSMLRATTAAVAKLSTDKEFTVRELLKKVPRELNRYDRWMVTRQRVTGAMNRLVKDGRVKVVGEAERGLFSANIYMKTDDF